MRSTTLIAWLTLAVILPVSAWALIEAPHNKAAIGSCGNCHGSHLADSPFWGGTPDYNTFCWTRCHNSPTDRVSKGPAAKTHSSVTTSSQRATWGYQCVACHTPHAQEQNNRDARKYDIAELYLATGYLTGPPVYNGSTTTFGVSSDPGKEIRYKNPNWTPATLKHKTEPNRGAVFIPNEFYSSYNYPIYDMAADGSTVTLYGDLSGEPWVPYISFYPFRIIYGQLLKGKIDKNNTPTDRSDDVPVKFFDRTGSHAFADNDGQASGGMDATPDGICQVCHENTGHWRNDGTMADHFLAVRCTVCHKHENGFGHPDGGGVSCHDCHNSGSHTVHLDPTASRGPAIMCDSCHDYEQMPAFVSGTDGNGDGLYSLAETDVCDPCHSAGGPFDGVNHADYGAKNNWENGVYDYGGGNPDTLVVDKGKWCVSCHDSGVSVIGGRQAPDVAGDNTNYGYYTSGHGSFATECGACHGFGMDHNFDGQKTYTKAGDNYKEGYRLSDVGGLDPMVIPNNQNSCIYNYNEFKLCYSCHGNPDESRLLNDPRLTSWNGCTTNPFKGNPASTGFRDESSGYNNLHWDHFAGIDFGSGAWYSEGPGQGNSNISCPSCHNPHGDSFGGNATMRMTHGDFQITWGSDGGGDFGQTGAGATFANRCSIACHGAGLKYYRDNPLVLNFSLSDNNSSDPTAAETGYTNNQTISISISNSGAAPAEMIFAEDAGFSVNSTGWIAYNASYSYSLTGGDGTRTVYGKIRNGSDESFARSVSIVLDTTVPSVGSNALSSPNGSETWIQDTDENITWSGIADSNLKSLPIALDYSTDSGSTFPHAIAASEANDGIYAWSVAVEESSTVQVRITATDRAGNQTSDTSDVDFTIAPVIPVLSGISLADNNSSDPSAAEAGYTNSQDVQVTLSVGNNPTQLMLAEDSGFTVNSTGWVAYSSPYTYTLTGGDASKTVYAKIKNGAGESGSLNSSIVLDTTNPAIQADTLIAPNGNADPLLAEYWPVNSSQAITWISGDITDANLKATPITLKYSINSGLSWSTTLTANEANDGSYTWNPLPAAERTTARVKLIVTDKAGNQSEDASDNNFNVSPPGKFIVTSTADTDTLGTLRYALNNLEDNAEIWFKISSTTNEVAEIVVTSSLPVITSAGVVIDGTSQAALVGSNNPNGPEVRIKGPGGSVDAFVFNADNGEIEGLQIGGFRYAASSSAENFVVMGNQFGFASDSTGFTTTGYSNTQSITLTGTSLYAYVGTSGYNTNYIACSTTGLLDNGTDNYIDANFFGLLPDESTVCSNTSRNIDVSASSASYVQRNVICGNSSYGLYIQNTANLTFRGNQIGVYYDGVSWVDCLDPGYGIYIGTSSGNSNNVIGGSLPALSDSNLRNSNVIDPGSVYGIKIRGTSSIGIPTKIYGNYIGTNPEEDEVFSGSYGIHMNESSAGPAYIGGYNAGEAGNVIANMTTKAVYVDSGATPVDYIGINRNSFYNNGTSLAGSDDSIFIGSGENGSITRPVIDSASSSQANISGVANGRIVEVYISDYDGSGTEYGEGKTLVGSATASGATVVVPLTGVIPSDWLTATQTSEASGKRRTSNFSANVQVP